MSSGEDRLITLAAGGVVWRDKGDDNGEGNDNDLLVAVVHRPRYDDWTLPKGKLKPGEHPLVAAVREVAEETGATVSARRRLQDVEYPLASGGHKLVSYWAMRYQSGRHRASDEVDTISWLAPAQAADRLTHQLDRDVLEDFARLPCHTNTVLLIRHASAGKRSEHTGDDRSRQLDKAGRRQARSLVPLLRAFDPVRVLAADLARCEQTVAPLADSIGLPLVSAPQFSDENYRRRPQDALRSLVSLAAEAGASVLCSQGDTIPGLLDGLITARDDYPSRKGSTWALSFLDGSVIAADYYGRTPDTSPS